MLCTTFSRRLTLNKRDTAGQEEYEAIRIRSYPDTDFFILVFSVESRASFDNLGNKWFPEVRKHCPTAQIIVVGAKSDLREDDGVVAEVASLGNPMLSKEEYEDLALKWGAKKYIECSALANENLNLIFDEILMLRRSLEQEESKREDINKRKSNCLIS